MTTPSASVGIFSCLTPRLACVGVFQLKTHTNLENTGCYCVFGFIKLLYRCQKMSIKTSASRETNCLFEPCAETGLLSNMIQIFTREVAKRRFLRLLALSFHEWPCDLRSWTNNLIFAYSGPRLLFYDFHPSHKLRVYLCSIQCLHLQISD